MRINLNDWVKVKLTDYGKEIFNHRFDEVNRMIKEKGGKPLTPIPLKVDEDGYSSFQLWTFMEMYGEHIGMAKPNVIMPLDIIIEDKQ